MRYAIKKKSGAQIEAEVTLTKEEFNKYYDSAYQKAFSEVEVKGFRKGTAPKELVERLIDKQKVFDEAAHEAVRRTLSELTEENKWVVIDKPQVEVLSAAADFKYKVVLTIFPEVKLADYKKIAAKFNREREENIKKISVSDQEVNKALKWLRDVRAKAVAVNRPAQKNDLIIIDYKKQGEAKKDQFVLGKGGVPPELEEMIIGKTSGSQIKWKEYDITITSVMRRELPDLNDEFAKSVGKFQNLEDLKKSLKEGIKMEQERKEQEKIRLKMLEEIADKSEVDIPEIMVAKMKEQSQESKEISRKRIKAHLVIHKIAEKENLNPTEEEMRQEIQRYQHQPDKLDKSEFYDYVYGIIQNKKVFEFLENQHA